MGSTSTARTSSTGISSLTTSSWVWAKRETLCISSTLGLPKNIGTQGHTNTYHTEKTRTSRGQLGTPRSTPTLALSRAEGTTWRVSDISSCTSSRAPCHGRACGLQRSSKSTRGSRRRRCPHQSTCCARELRVSLPPISTTVGRSDLRRSQTTVICGNCSETCFTGKASPTTTSSTGTCSSLVGVEALRQKQTHATRGNRKYELPNNGNCPIMGTA